MVLISHHSFLDCLTCAYEKGIRDGAYQGQPPIPQQPGAYSNDPEQHTLQSSLPPSPPDFTNFHIKEESAGPQPAPPFFSTMCVVAVMLTPYSLLQDKNSTHK